MSLEALEEKINEIDSRVKNYESEQAILLAIEKNNRRWIIGISTLIFGVLGISYTQLPGVIYNKIDAIVTEKIAATAQEELSLLLAEAEEVAYKIQTIGAEADLKRNLLAELESQANQLVAGLQEAQVAEARVYNRRPKEKNDPLEPTNPEVLPTPILPVDTADQGQWVILFENYYAKANYFLPLGDDFRIKVDNLDPNEAMVTIYSKNGGCEKNARLEPGDIVNVECDQKTYRITLNAIGPAGFNRFTKAAFFKAEQRI